MLNTLIVRLQIDPADLMGVELWVAKCGIKKAHFGKISSDLDVKIKLNGVVERTDGLSGAYLKEIVMTAYMISTETNQKLTRTF